MNINCKHVFRERQSRRTTFAELRIQALVIREATAASTRAYHGVVPQVILFVLKQYFFSDIPKLTSYFQSAVTTSRILSH
jgi:hypothetical protein